MTLHSKTVAITDTIFTCASVLNCTKTGTYIGFGGGLQPTYKEEVVELSSTDHLTCLFRLEVAKELHADHREPDQED